MTTRRRRISNVLRYGSRLLRLREFWDKLLHIGACAVLLRVRPGPAAADAPGMVLYLAGVFFLLIGGYAVNDVADFRQDRLAGGKPGASAPRREHSLAASIAALSLGAILIMTAAGGVLPRAVAAGSILLGVEYSLPPLRFKERGIWGVVIGALTQRPALFLVWAATLDAWDRIVVVLTLWLFFVGMIGMLGHQVVDRGRDKAGRVGTFVFRQGPRPALRLGAACAIAAGLATVAPLIVMPFAKAWPYAATLAAMSGVSIGKGMKAFRKIGPLGSM